MNPQHPCPLQHSRWLVCVFLVIATVAGVSGCGKGPPVVSGIVKYKGEPIKVGDISFFPDTGKDRGSSIVEGEYKIVDAEPGPTTITVKVDMTVIGKKTTPADLVKYASKTTSPLKYTVQKGNQTHNIELP
jgi:hypothetical protein